MKAMGFRGFLRRFIVLEFGMALYFTQLIIQLIQLIQIIETKVASSIAQLHKLLTLIFFKLTFLYAKVMYGFQA